MRTIARPSPNHDERPCAPDMLVLHYTGMKTADEAMARLCDPEAKVSAHYTIDEDGTVYAHVPEARRAWHAGLAWWAGERNINGCSIGIELVNPGHEFGYRPFADPQIAALIDLVDDIATRHAIVPARVLGHSDVAPARKTDPGELFPWAHLAEFGIGLWPFADGCIPSTAEAEEGDRDPLRIPSFLSGLRALGYGTAPDMDVATEQLVIAFQRHWRPSRVDGMIDDETAYRLGVLLEHLS
jgi:N-acetylmuramoyl-L-alanine amidase